MLGSLGQRAEKLARLKQSKKRRPIGGKGELMSEYLEFIASKDRSVTFNQILESFMPSEAFDYQQAIIRWALRKGRACIFAGTGLGKTLMELAWAENVQRWSKWRVLVLAPLAVSDQIVSEGERFGINVTKIRGPQDIGGPGIYVTNYAKLHMVRTCS